jgi:Raf kinase inhibitor-like YbhB/YbcL family protein
MTLQLRCARFADGAPIPRAFTCEGEDRSPPLEWDDAPPGTRSLALVVDDPDAPDPAHPRTRWVHWVLYNLPPSARALPEAVAPAALPAGTLEGLNDWKRTGYGGPCPPIGRHRYVHRLYALDALLPDLHAPTRAQLEAALQGHVLAQAELVGTYEKSGH